MSGDECIPEVKFETERQILLLIWGDQKSKTNEKLIISGACHLITQQNHCLRPKEISQFRINIQRCIYM